MTLPPVVRCFKIFNVEGANITSVADIGELCK